MLADRPALSEAVAIVYHHHERYDGTGYLDGLKGEEIPLGARVLAVADAFVAMTSDRPYRSAMSAAQALAELRDKAGTQFDPRVVAAFERALRGDGQRAPHRGAR
jgi:HD-GYP domain-containing protein (c-di-GMP phosphodiesterase class II)